MTAASGENLQRPIPSDNTSIYILNEDAVKRQVQSGMFATAYSCDQEEIDNYGLKGLYKQHADLEDCTIFWDLRK